MKNAAHFWLFLLRLVKTLENRQNSLILVTLVHFSHFKLVEPKTCKILSFKP